MKNYFLKFFVYCYIVSFFNIIPTSAFEIELLNSSEDELIFSISNIDYNFDYISIDNNIYKRIIIPGEISTGNPGEPEIPVISKMFGIPDDKRAEVHIVDSDFFIVNDENIAPVPEIERFKNNDNIEEFKYRYFFDKNVYSTDSYLPGNIAEIANEGFIRKQKVCSVKIHPVHYNPKKKVLKVYKYIKVSIKFAEKQNLEKTPVKNKISIKHFNDTFRGLINYNDIVKWNANRASVLRKVETGRDIYSVNNFQYKIEAEKDGLYKLTYDYLISEGINISGTDPRVIKIFNKGEEIPIYISGEEDGVFDKSDYLIFYGKRNTDSLEYYDPFTDSNVYWLSLSGENGKRLEDYDGTVKNGIQADFFREKLHERKEF